MRDDDLGNFELDVSLGRWSWSPALFTMLGVDPAVEPTTALLMAAKHPNDRVSTRRSILAARNEGCGFHHHSRIVRRDGAVRVLETDGTVSKSRDGVVRAVQGTVAPLSAWAGARFEPDQAGRVEEGDLWVALVARLEDAHTYVFGRYAEIVRREAGRIVRTREQGDDVVQAVFTELWSYPTRFDPSRGSLTTFLRVQARSRSIDLVRSEEARRRREASWAVDGTRGSTRDDPFEVVSQSDVRQALAKLPARERVPIERAYFGAMTYRAVAVDLGTPEGTVKSNIRTGLIRLRELCRPAP